MSRNYDQEKKRQAEFIIPPNTLKRKVGTGGLSVSIINKAQSLLENNSVDFRPMGDMYLEDLMKGIETCQFALPDDDNEYLISTLMYPTIQLKSNAAMFHYKFVSELAEMLIGFLEVIETPDYEALEIVLAFYTSIRAALVGKIMTRNREGEHLITELNGACMRYFKKNPDNIDIGSA